MAWTGRVVRVKETAGSLKSGGEEVEADHDTR